MLKSISLAAHNYRVLIKSILFQAIVLALVVAILFTALGGLFDSVVGIVRDSGLEDFLQQTINSIADGTFNSADFTGQLNLVITNVQQSVETVGNFWGSIAMAYLLAIFMLCGYRVLVSVTDVAVGCQLEEFMTSNAERPFTWYFFKKQRRTWLFALLQMAMTLPLDILIVCSVFGFYLLFLIAFGWWTIIPACLVAIALYAARLTAFAFCLPACANETNIYAGKAFKHGLSLIVYRFWHMYWRTLLIVTLMVAISVVGIVFIDNAILKTLVVTVTNFVLFFYLKCLNMVKFFDAQDKPYFYKRMYIEGTERHTLRQERAQRKQQLKQRKQNKK